MTTQLEEAKGMCEGIKLDFFVKKISCEELKLEVETKGKECQRLEDEVVNLKKELEKWQDEIKIRIKFGGCTNYLDKMLSKQKLNKDTTGLGCDVGQCSTRGETSKKEIKFVASIQEDNRKIFSSGMLKERR